MIQYSDLHIPPQLWNLISRANRDEARMRDILIALTRQELILFNYYFNCAVTALLARLQSKHLNQRSEDTEEQIAGMVVSQGELVFKSCFSDPKQMLLFTEDDGIDSYYGLAEVVYYDRFHEAIPAYTDDPWNISQD